MFSEGIFPTPGCSRFHWGVKVWRLTLFRQNKWSVVVWGTFTGSRGMISREITSRIAFTVHAMKEEIKCLWLGTVSWTQIFSGKLNRNSFYLGFLSIVCYCYAVLLVKWRGGKKKAKPYISVRPSHISMVNIWNTKKKALSCGSAQKKIKTTLCS